VYKTPLPSTTSICLATVSQRTVRVLLLQCRCSTLVWSLKCLLPVMRPTKTPTYLKHEVNRLRKRRVRWTIRGDRTDVDYEVETNTATLPTVNALLHSIVSTHSCMVVDYYLGAILPSPEPVRIDVSFISLPTLTKLGLLPFLLHSHGKPQCTQNCPWPSPIRTLVPTSSCRSPHPTWLHRNLHPHALPSSHSLYHLLPCGGRCPRPLFRLSELDHLVSCLSTLYELKVHRDLPHHT
jgi:hypothetical protein